MADDDHGMENTESVAKMMETESSTLGEIEIDTSEDIATMSRDIDARYSYSDIANYLSSGIYPAGADKATKCANDVNCLKWKVGTFIMSVERSRRSPGLLYRVRVSNNVQYRRYMM